MSLTDLDSIYIHIPWQVLCLEDSYASDSLTGLESLPVEIKGRQQEARIPRMLNDGHTVESAVSPHVLLFDEIKDLRT